jgi:hypothetical protein
MEKFIDRPDVIFCHFLIPGINFPLKNIIIILLLFLFFFFLLIFFILLTFLGHFFEIIIFSVKIQFFFFIINFLFKGSLFDFVILLLIKKIFFVILEQNFVFSIFLLIFIEFLADFGLFKYRKQLLIDGLRFWMNGSVFSQKVPTDFKFFLDTQGN